MQFRTSLVLLLCGLSSSLSALELADADYRCWPKTAGSINLTEVTIERDLSHYQYVVNPMRGLKFGINLDYQGSCKFLSSTGNTISCEWDATRLIFNPDLAKFVLSDMSPSMEFVFGVVGDCLKVSNQQH
jgi:hypothetical protein